MESLPAGVMVALATPLHRDGRLDRGGLARLLDRVLGAGVHGISPVGSTGEGARLTADGRCEVVAAVRKHVGRDLPVIAGLPASNVAAAKVELTAAAGAGADAALVAPPSYYPASDAEVEALYAALAEDTPIPLVLYNIPKLTGVSISPAVAGRLAPHPRIIGMKDSSGDMQHLTGVVYAVENDDFGVYTGTDSLLLAALQNGAIGTIAASVNLVPALAKVIWDAVQADDLAVATATQRRLFDIVTACRRGGIPVGWKAALQLAGVCDATLAQPAIGLPAADYDALRTDLGRLDTDGTLGVAGRS